MKIHEVMGGGVMENAPSRGRILYRGVGVPQENRHHQHASHV